MPLFTSIGLAVGASAATAAATGAAIVGAAAAAAGAGYSISAGEDAKRKQANALQRQEATQTEAVKTAEDQRKQGEMVINKANRQSPNVSSIMQAAGASARGGAAGTMLTGPTGVDPNALSLGKSSLLGS